MSIDEMLNDTNNDGIVYFTDFNYDSAIIGIDTYNRVIYDYYKMIDWLIENEEFTEEDAVEWIDYNTIRSLPYIDGQTNGKAPIIIYSIDYVENMN